MSATAFLSFMKYVLLVSYTPGPSNIYSLNTSIRYGFKRFLKVYSGLITGFFIVLLGSVFITYGFSLLPPVVTTALRIIGGIYILILAWHIWKSTPIDAFESEETSSKLPGFLNGLFLNLTNIKVMFFSLSVYQMYLIRYYHSLAELLLWCIPMSFLGSCSTIVWALLGQGLASSYNRYYKLYNTILSLSLLLCVIELFL